MRPTHLQPWEEEEGQGPKSEQGGIPESKEEASERDGSGRSEDSRNGEQPGAAPGRMTVEPRGWSRLETEEWRSWGGAPGSLPDPP